jgi:hypothetical protein
LILPTWIAALSGGFAGVAAFITLLFIYFVHKREQRAYVKVSLDSVDGVHEINAILKGRRPPLGGSTMHIEWDPVAKRNTDPIIVHNPPREQIYRLTIKNHGKTNANNVTINYHVTVDDYPTPRNPIVQRERTISAIRRLRRALKVKSTLAPDSDVNAFPYTENVIQDDELLGLRIGKKAFYIYGCIGYTDIFRQDHLTYFRFAHMGDFEGFDTSPDNFVVHHQGNYAT